MTFALRLKRNLPALGLALACLALAMKLLVPPGFMAAAPAEAAPFPLVLCTPQGMVAVGAHASPAHDGGEPAGPSGQRADHVPCVFAAAQHLAPPPALDHSTRVAFAACAALTRSAPASLAPGRGLCAPPLPARGPPGLAA